MAHWWDIEAARRMMVDPKTAPDIQRALASLLEEHDERGEKIDGLTEQVTKLEDEKENAEEEASANQTDAEELRKQLLEATRRGNIQTRKLAADIVGALCRDGCAWCGEVNGHKESCVAEAFMRASR